MINTENYMSLCQCLAVGATCLFPLCLSHLSLFTLLAFCCTSASKQLLYLLCPFLFMLMHSAYDCVCGLCWEREHMLGKYSKIISWIPDQHRFLNRSCCFLGLPALWLVLGDRFDSETFVWIVMSDFSRRARHLKTYKKKQKRAHGQEF